MKKNLIILIAVIALVFSFTSCKDTSDPVENYFALMEASDAAGVITNPISVNNTKGDVVLTLEDYAETYDAINAIKYYVESIPDSVTPEITSISGTVNISTKENKLTGDTSRTGKVSDLSISYKFINAEGKEVTGKVTGSAEISYVQTFNEDQTEVTNVSEAWNINLNGKAYGDIHIKTVVNLKTYKREVTAATIGGKQVSLTMMNLNNN